MIGGHFIQWNNPQRTHKQHGTEKTTVRTPVDSFRRYNRRQCHPAPPWPAPWMSEDSKSFAPLCMSLNYRNSALILRLQIHFSKQAHFQIINPKVRRICYNFRWHHSWESDSEFILSLLMFFLIMVCLILKRVICYNQNVQYMWDDSGLIMLWMLCVWIIRNSWNW